MTDLNNFPSLPIEAIHVSQFLEDLSTRIARLAIGLGIPLQTEAEILQAIHAWVEPPPPLRERRASDHVATVSPERRSNRLRSELRGLLVMRFEAEAKLVELVGGDLSRQVLRAVELKLENQGFLPGVGGATVKHAP